MPCSTGCRVCSARAPARSRKGATRAKENSARAKAIWKTSRPPAVSDFTIAELTVKPRLAAIIQRAQRWLGESFSQPPDILEWTAVIQGWSLTDTDETCSVASSRATRDSGWGTKKIGRAAWWERGCQDVETPGVPVT